MTDTLREDVSYVRGRIDDLTKEVHKLGNTVEHRLTKLEQRAGLIALLVSAVVSIAAAVAK